MPKRPETPKQRHIRLELESRCSNIAYGIAQALPPNTGFALLLNDFVVDGSMAYTSNVDRRDIIRMMREMADKLEVDGPKFPKDQWWRELGILGQRWKDQEGLSASDLDRMAELACQAETLLGSLHTEPVAQQ